MDKRFQWTEFYMELASALLHYKNNRSDLIAKLKTIFADAGMNFPFKERGKEVYEDICPFTVFGSFNKGITNANRIALLEQFAMQFSIKAAVPTEFDGIPVVMNLSAWFFAYKENRGEHDIDNLWDFKNYLAEKNSPKLESLITAVESLNNTISADESLGDGFRIGHSYFCTDGEITDEWLKSVAEYEVIPLIKEYWFDEPTKVRDWSATLRSAIK